ncbi:hypothetical protein THASP1DRAFT_13815 [Thamnocephalis sphaerospora]|uniref:cytochrome-b5 reductase n=1 Tax=Thamnocephalis sphaerospora TaxID=78915 RepID=A0A4P9XU88_9FUNG|nr:hypothetical protein THASP1DRAFT_13815 [Thamnocephalis sphaerospora]|eukprot:RKP09778.1 hypothetical protein THASP1DRAFT_13815 [Thamnocephalis sphaerospora]
MRQRYAGAYYYYSSQTQPTAKAAEAPKEAKAPSSALNPKDFKPFKLAEVNDISHNTRHLRFELDSPEQTFGLKVASCVVARLPAAEGQEGDYIIRPYTPISREDEKGHVDFIIKVYPDGKLTQKIFKLKPGDQLEMKGPIPKFPYEANKYKHIGLIAGSYCGITPMLQVARKVLDNANDHTTLSLLFANVTEEDILARKELEDFVAQHPDRIRVHYTLDNPPKGWNQYVGFVSSKMVKETMPEPAEGNIVMVCGPPPMLASVSGPKGPKFTQGEVGGILKELGYNESQVFKF